MICNGKTFERQLKCGNPLYRCKKCGSLGCGNKDCPNQISENGHCKKCGNWGMERA